MKKQIAEVLGLEAVQVNVKAKTKEGLDSEGSGFSVTAQAIATLVKE